MKISVHPYLLMAFAAAAIATSVVAAAGEEEAAREHGTIATKGVDKRGYPKMAKISAAKAAEIAKAEAQGRIVSNKLESEDGFLVYAIEVATADAGKREILVDAGTGKVLPGDQDSEGSEKDDD